MIDNRLSKKFICEQTNKIYEKQLVAASELNISRTQISNILNGKKKSVKGYSFKYMDDSEE